MGSSPMDEMLEGARILLEFVSLDPVPYSSWLLGGPSDEPFGVVSIACLYPSAGKNRGKSYVYRLYEVGDRPIEPGLARYQILNYSLSESQLQETEAQQQEWDRLSEEAARTKLRDMAREAAGLNLPLVFVAFGRTRGGDPTAHLWHHPLLPPKTALEFIQRLMQDLTQV